MKPILYSSHLSTGWEEWVQVDYEVYRGQDDAVHMLLVEETYPPGTKG